MGSSTLFGWRKRTTTHEHLDKRLFSQLHGFRVPRLGQWKYLGRLLSTRERRSAQILVVLILVNVAFLGFRLYQRGTDVVPTFGGQYTEGLVGSPQYINPILLHSNDSDRDLASLLFSGLVRYGQDRSIVPDLAERYEMSQDARAYTFFVRRNARWHDDAPVTADDVVFTIERIKDPVYKSPLFASYKDIAVTRIDEHTVRFTLPKPFAPFLDLATVGILPRHVWEAVGPESFALSALNMKAIGSGPWKFKTFQKDRDGTIRSYTVARNDTYYGTRAFLTQAAFRFYPDVDSAVHALKNRNVDGISFLPRALSARLTQDTGLKHYEFALPQYTAIFFNPQNNPDLKNLAVRASLAHLLDKEAIVQEALSGKARVINQPLFGGFLGSDAVVTQYGHDAIRAGELLSSAGWKREGPRWVKSEPASSSHTPRGRSGGSGEEKKRVLRVTLVTVNQDEMRVVAETISRAWQRGGIQVDIEYVDPSRIKTDVIDPRRYEALLFGAIVGADPDLYPFWHSSQVQAPGLNLAMFSDAKADRLLEEGRSNSDPRVRAHAYRQFQTILSEQLPAIFLFNPTYTYVVSKRIQGVPSGTLLVHPSDRFSTLGSWYAKSKRQLKKSTVR